MEASKKEERLIKPPVGYEPTIARWVWALEDTRRRTKRCLDGIADEIIDWIPPEGSNSIGTVLYHIAAIEMSYLYEDILEIGWYKELEPLIVYDVRDDRGRLTVVNGESLAKHLERLDAGRALLLKALGQMAVDDFGRPRHKESYEITPEWTLHHLMQHEAEHRGQMAEIRIMAEKAVSG